MNIRSLVDAYNNHDEKIWLDADRACSCRFLEIMHELPDGFYESYVGNSLFHDWELVHMGIEGLANTMHEATASLTLSKSKLSKKVSSPPQVELVFHNLSTFEIKNCASSKGATLLLCAIDKNENGFEMQFLFTNQFSVYISFFNMSYSQTIGRV